MQPSLIFPRFAGWLALLALPCAWAGLFVGLSAVGYDFEGFSDPATVLAIGNAGAGLIRWGFWLTMLGSYLFLTPLAFWLEAQASQANTLFARWITFCGLGYLSLGAAGAAMLAASWPALIEAATAEPGSSEAILVAFRTATALAERGLQGPLQNLAGALWWAGLGWLLLEQRRALAIFSYLLGLCSFLNALGGISQVEALNFVGLVGTLILAPLWAAWAGLIALRTRQHTV
jgi:hypothetical protein